MIFKLVTGEYTSYKNAGQTAGFHRNGELVVLRDGESIVFRDEYSWDMDRYSWEKEA